MRTKKHRRGRCFLLAMPYSVCYDGKNTKRGENIMRKRCIALVLCLLTLAALTGCGRDKSVLTERKYTDDEIQALADAGISFAEACEKISTVADAAQFLEARGYSFAPDDAGIGAALRYQLNSGACVGTSALFGALLNGDYDEVGYVYVFWLESEHVFNYVKQDGVYYACDFIYGPVTQSGTDARRSSIRYSGESLSGLFDAYAQQEGSDIGNAVAIMYTTAYCGDPTMPAVWLRDSADGHQSTIHLSDAEKDTQQILLLREIQGLSYDEIAQALSLEVGTVKSRIFRARKRLCTFLIDDGNISDFSSSGKMKGGESQ